MLSAALDVILTTLRYLAPATLLTLFWGQESFLFKLLKHIDSAFRAIVFSSEDQKRAVVQWLDETAKVRVETLNTVWRHGWILCEVLDAAIPGACSGHPPSRLSLTHAQAIADDCLGVEPVFSRQELESHDSLSKHQEWKLATYLDRIRLALAKLTPPVSKPVSQRTSPETTQFTVDYVARGSGLSAAQVNTRMHFKIYPTGQQSLDPREITILIKGPKDTYGMTVLPPIMGKAQLIRQKLLGLQNKQNFTENVLPITQGATYLRAYGKNNMNKTYYIPKTRYDIEIEGESHADHIKVSYTVKLEGRYEISITSKGQNIVGSPYTVIASHNIIGTLERESFCLENGEEIDIVDVKTDKKAVLRIVDFGTEKMLLKENGSLEKITDNEARILMSTENMQNITTPIDEPICNVLKNYTNATLLPCSNDRNKKFQKTVRKIITTSRVCKAFVDYIPRKHILMTITENGNSRPKHQDIPDIVNSTLSDAKPKPYHISDSRDKIIIPDRISVSILTEKHEPNFVCDTTLNEIKTHSLVNDIDNQDSLEEYCLTHDDSDDNSLVSNKTNSPNNPFINDRCEHDYETEKDLGSFVTNEYETNNSQCEKIENTSVKILIDENDETTTTNNNPFIDTDLIKLTRPKSPVFKIISGEKCNRDDTGYIENKPEKLNEEILGNEFINPFFIHQHLQSSESLPIADFKIGAPVSLPPIIRATSPVPDMESLIITNNVDNTHELSTNNDKLSPVFSTPIPANQVKIEEHNLPVSSTLHSFNSEVAGSSPISKNNSQHENYQIDTEISQNITPKKDLWDSAYVSIDDNNCSPDSNNNDNIAFTESVSKPKFSPNEMRYGLKREELSNIGPAEREIWQTCSELNDDILIIHEDTSVKPNKFEFKRPIFTPIIEENDRSIPSGMKNIKKAENFEKDDVTDAITVAFAELNDLYQEHFPNVETNSTIIPSVDNKLQRQEKEHTIDTIYVDSASEIETDVKRQKITKNTLFEGKISEVQTNATESISASHTLQENKTQQSYKYQESNKIETQFGDKKYTNIVLEKKKYWDERIRQIEAKSEESTTLQKKRRLSSRHLRNNDSLTKRRGKQIVKNFLKADENKNEHGKSLTLNKSNVKTLKTNNSQESIEQVESDIKLVEKWKKYWDNKLETDNIQDTISCFKTNIPKSNQTPIINIEEVDETDNNDYESKLASPVKQELPEEVFKAFETSPKRFFGTSRKQILNKIDTFLGKPSTVDKSSVINGASQDSGLVSSRISLFHKISNTEDLLWSNRKSQSMHNIHQNKYSNKNIEDTLSTFNDKTFESDNEQRINDIKLDMSTKNTSSNNLVHISLTDKSKKVPSLVTKGFESPNSTEERDPMKKDSRYVKNIIKQINYDNHQENKHNKLNKLYRTSISKSEMDIFNKTTDRRNDEDFDKYKSCDELPKINVKNFISLYESVSSTVKQPTLTRKLSKVNIQYPQKPLHISNSTSVVAENIINQPQNSSQQEIYQEHDSYKSFESVSIDSIDTKTSNSYELEPENREKETTYVSLSDIELEIVESPNKSIEPSPERDEDAIKKDYKSRFKMAKEFFQSLEEIRDVKKPIKLNECQQIQQNKSSESPETKRTQKRIKKIKKSHSMPSSEIAKIWNEMQENENNDCSSKLTKISEKFNVDGLFSDVVSGKLSRQGSLRGIAHKKAVLEAFRSMENISDRTISPYEMAMSETNNVTNENQIKSAQTYLSEYPYLPTTDPSKSQSRLDAKASGLITLKELMNKKPRRNSVPDLRLNTSFTADL
ncbi:uncharacterized protein LOC113518673 isoform X2 [Galleria mellonella]|nr:uncharacterized protein LOC113518673 isoform X2 [Galleria mellonella]XP_031763984.2 uncharacterized protein LOC113518673 isoform X2 [Galleria mellonella]